MSSPGSYRGSAGRVKTLDILATCRDILTLEQGELQEYLRLVKQECGCLDASEAAESLHARYGWDCRGRMAEISRTWLDLDVDETASPTKPEPAKASPPNSTKKAAASSSAKKQPIVSACLLRNSHSFNYSLQRLFIEGFTFFVVVICS